MNKPRLTNGHGHEEDGVVKSNMHEIHTGHLPKAQFATVSGPLEMQRQPQRARVQTVENIFQPKRYATLWEPPVMKYTQHYSRVDNRFNDLNKEQREQDEYDSLRKSFESYRRILNPSQY